MKITRSDDPCCEDILEAVNEIVTILNGGISASDNTNIYYNEVLSVGAGILTTIITHTTVVEELLQSIIVSGTNIAEYTVLLNGNIIIKIRTEFTSLNETIPFPPKGFKLIIGDIITVKVVHTRPSVGDFNVTLKIDN